MEISIECIRNQTIFYRILLFNISHKISYVVTLKKKLLHTAGLYLKYINSKTYNLIHFTFCLCIYICYYMKRKLLKYMILTSL